MNGRRVITVLSQNWRINATSGRGPTALHFTLVVGHLERCIRGVAALTLIGETRRGRNASLGWTQSNMTIQSDVQCTSMIVAAGICLLCFLSFLFCWMWRRAAFYTASEDAATQTKAFSWCEDTTCSAWSCGVQFHIRTEMVRRGTRRGM